MARILVANKFYYPRGGDCVYAMNLVDLLQSHGHEVAVFAMQHPDTLQTKWNDYFPSEVKLSLGLGLFKTALRPFGTNEVRRKFNVLLDRFQPDIVHLNNIHTQLSPVIAELAHQRGINVVWKNCLISFAALAGQNHFVMMDGLPYWLSVIEYLLGVILFAMFVNGLYVRYKE